MPALRHWLASQVLERVLDLPQPLTRNVAVHRDLRVPMPDGVQLLADHYRPAGADRSGTGAPPTVLVRSPYGRRGAFGLLYGRPLAERGFQVLVQSVRGTFGSGGRFQPYQHEREDGLATVRWIREQPWFGGRLGTTGISYLGYVQWAIADDAGLDAMCLQATTADFSRRTYDGGSFSLGLSLSWTRGMVLQNSRRAQLTRKTPELTRALDHLPLSDGDAIAIGRTVDWYQDWLAYTPQDEYWQSASHTDRVAKVQVPVAMRTGWYDIFLPWNLRDYRLLAEAGNAPRLTIGPWSHSSFGMIRSIGRETVEFLGEHLLGHAPTAGPQVRFFVTGCDEWRDAPTWPPPGVRSHDWALLPAGELHSADGDGPDPASPAGSASRFRYDPARPTPAVGGPALDNTRATPDNRDLEARSDVLVFSTLPLATPLEVIGTPVARIAVSSDNPNHDLFVRLCDVHPDGTSINVCDRLIRLDPGSPPAPAAPEWPDDRPVPHDGDELSGVTDARTGDGVRIATLELWPTAHKFLAGHRVRVQVSGGAHPRYARNPGAGEPLATAQRLVTSDVSVHHDSLHRSSITLPISG